MQSMTTFLLPGGLLHENTLSRSAVMSPVTGGLEQSLLENSYSENNLADRVSKILSQVVNQIGNHKVDFDLVKNLCVADRQFLMLQLAQMLGNDHVWLHSDCDNCNEPFDVSVARSQLPVEPAGQSYPFALAEVQGCKIRLRIPNGADQEKITGLDDAHAIRKLLQLCIVTLQPKRDFDEFIASLTNSDLEIIDTALDESSPAVCASVITQCPVCEASQNVYLDPYQALFTDANTLYQQVHMLAYYYHWNEADILALPKSRRRFYLSMIDQARGFSH